MPKTTDKPTDARSPVFRFSRRFPIGRFAFAEEPKPDDGEAAKLRQQLADSRDENTKLKKKVADLEKDNYDYREARRTMETEIENLKKNPAGEGNVVVKKEDADALEEIRKAAPEGDLKKAKDTIEKGAKAIAELDAIKKDKVYTDAASIAKYNPTVLTDVLKARNLSVEIETEKVKDGDKVEDVQVAYVVDADKKKTKLVEYAESNLKEFLPSLKVEGGGNPGGGGTNWVPQGGGSGGGSGDGSKLVDKFLEDRNKKQESQTNPLQPAQPSK